MIRIPCLIVLISLSLTVSASPMPAAWNTRTSGHFIVCYRNCDQVFVDQILKSAESGYRSIASQLRFDPSSKWSGDNRAKIYIYDTKEQYLLETGEPVWSDGSSIQRLRIILSFKGAQGLFDRILAHELAHIMFRETVGFSNTSIPAWLEEGFAASQEKGDILEQKRSLKDFLDKGRLFGLEQLSGIDPRSLKDKGQLDLFYGQSASIVEYLVREKPPDRFPALCRNLKEGKDLAASLKLVYKFNAARELEASWKEYLRSLSF